MIELQGVHDGDQGWVYEFAVTDSGALRAQDTFAIEFKIEDGRGNLIATRPGVLKSPKSGSEVQLYLKGSECDRAGTLRNLVVKPKIYYATGMDGQPAVNLLVNASFDAATGSSPARLPDSWTLIGAQTATWDNHATDSAPPSIFGTVQAVTHATTSEPDYIQQVPAVSLSAGDTLSVGAWHRISGIAGDAAGGVKNNTHGIFFHAGAQSNTIVQFEIGTHDWYFVTGSVVTPTAETAATMGIDGRGTTSSNRYDEAFCFKGFWRIFHSPLDGYKIPILHSSRPIKTTNQVAGIGGFEQDWNADGLADDLFKTGSTNTYSIEKDPANVSQGSASQKIVLSNASSESLKVAKRGRFLTGETWKASVKEKTSGTLGSGAGTGGFNIVLRSDYFDTTVPESANTNLGVTVASFTAQEVQLTLTADHDLLVIEINLNGKTGTMWLDDLHLEKV